MNCRACCICMHKFRCTIIFINFSIVQYLACSFSSLCVEARRVHKYGPTLANVVVYDVYIMKGVLTNQEISHWSIRFELWGSMAKLGFSLPIFGQMNCARVGPSLYTKLFLKTISCFSLITSSLSTWPLFSFVHFVAFHLIDCNFISIFILLRSSKPQFKR